jgi:hypothetical protein
MADARTVINLKFRPLPNAPPTGKMRLYEKIRF